MTGAHDSVGGARRADFLAGVRVLELGDGVAGSAATSILWSLGAEVTAVVDRTSPHRRTRPLVPLPGGDASLLSISLDRGKQVRGLRDLTQLGELLRVGGGGAGFGVVVVDRIGGLRGPLGALTDIDAYTGFVEANNLRAWLTISAFGLTGGRRADVATELTLAAASGMLAAVRDERTGQPLKLGGQQSLRNTGQAAALAACHAFDLAATGAAVHLDLSAVEATVAMGPVLEVGGLLLNTGGGGGAKRYGAPAGFYGCVDGLVRISAMEDHQWQGVIAAMGSPDWAERFATVQARIDDPEEIDRHVEAWAQRRSKRDAETVLQSHGVPASAVYSPAEILESPQLTHRGAIEPLPLGDGRDARVAGMPFCIVDGGNRGAKRGRRRSLRGLRMLEASRVLAVPLAGSILGALGVEVTKLEDLPRLDMYRRRGPYIDGEPGMERSAYFALMNHSKQSAAFDVEADRARLDALLASSDVVIENLGRKRAVGLGVSSSVVPDRHENLLALSSSGFGQDGPHADYRAYAYNLQASGGLGFLTRNEEGQGAEIDIAWADLVSAYALATIIAAWAIGPMGNAGVGLDFSMTDLVVAHFNEHLAAASLDPAADESVDRANELTPFAPNGVYPTVDGWIALSVEDDEQYSQLAKALAHDALADPSFSDAEARVARRRFLDVLMAEATRSHEASALAPELRMVGVTAEEVVSPAGLLESPQLVARELFTTVEHEVWGRRRLVGVPWRAFDGPALQLGAPPQLEARGDDARES